MTKVQTIKEIDAETLKELPEKALNAFIESMLNHLDSPEKLTLILKGHLYIESVLNTILETSSLYPEKLQVEKMTFKRKVELCEIFGFIHSEIIPSLKKLSKLRNGFAHLLEMELNGSDEKDFCNVVKQSPILYEAFQKTSLQWKNDVSKAIWVIWFYLFGQLLRNVNCKKQLGKYWESNVDAKNINYNSTLKFLKSHMDKVSREVIKNMEAK